MLHQEKSGNPGLKSFFDVGAVIPICANRLAKKRLKLIFKLHFPHFFPAFEICHFK
jgi:hypothetical protein